MKTQILILLCASMACTTDDISQVSPAPEGTRAGEDVNGRRDATEDGRDSELDGAPHQNEVKRRSRGKNRDMRNSEIPPHADTATDTEILDAVIDGVEVIVDRSQHDKMQVTLRIQDIDATIDLLRLPAGSALYFGDRVENFHDFVRDPGAPPESFPIGYQAADLDFKQVGLLTSQHPFTLSSLGVDLLVLPLEKPLDLLVAPMDLDGTTWSAIIQRVANLSTAAVKSEWVRGLSHLGIGGIYRRGGPATTGPGADGEVFITHPSPIRHLRRAGIDELLGLVASASWLPPNEMWRPQALAKLRAIKRCEREGAGWEEILSGIRGPAWTWLRAIAQTEPGKMSDSRKEAVWSACEVESPDLMAQHPSRQIFIERFCDKVLPHDFGTAQRSTAMTDLFVDHLCDREGMQSRGASQMGFQVE